MSIRGVLPPTFGRDLAQSMIRVDKHTKWLAVSLILLVFITGLGYSISLGDKFRYVDERMYYTFAENLHKRSFFSLDGIHPTAIKSPGYSFLLTMVMLVSESVFAIRFLNYIALSISLWLVFVLVQKHSRPSIGLVALLIAASYPLFFYTASTLYPQTIGTLLLMLILFLFFQGNEQKLSVWSHLAIGLLAGFLILTIPTFLPFVFILVAWRAVSVGERMEIVVLLLAV